MNRHIAENKNAHWSNKHLLQTQPPQSHAHTHTLYACAHKYTHTHTHTHTRALYACAHKYTHTRTRTHTHTHAVRVCTQIHTHAHTCTRVNKRDVKWSDVCLSCRAARESEREREREMKKEKEEGSEQKQGLREILPFPSLSVSLFLSFLHSFIWWGLLTEGLTLRTPPLHVLSKSLLLFALSSFFLLSFCSVSVSLSVSTWRLHPSPTHTHTHTHTHTAFPVLLTHHTS